MKDLGENPCRTMWEAICDLAKWWLVIFATWGVGAWVGMWIGGGYMPNPIWIVWGPCVSLVAWLACPVIVLGLGTTAVAWYLPMQIDSRKLAIGAVIANAAVWMAIGAYVS